MCSGRGFVEKIPPQYPFPFSADDHVVRNLSDLATELRVSQSFVRLCFDAGCPQAGKHASVASVLVWLFEHYEDLRALAGLCALAPVDGLPADTVSRLRMANALLTILEYTRSRTSDWRQKRRMRLAAEEMNRLVDRLP